MGSTQWVPNYIYFYFTKKKKIFTYLYSYKSNPRFLKNRSNIIISYLKSPHIIACLESLGISIIMLFLFGIGYNINAVNLASKKKFCTGWTKEPFYLDNLPICIEKLILHKKIQSITKSKLSYYLTFSGCDSIVFSSEKWEVLYKVRVIRIYKV